jgi:hypothetical protein
MCKTDIWGDFLPGKIEGYWGILLAPGNTIHLVSRPGGPYSLHNLDFSGPVEHAVLQTSFCGTIGDPIFVTHFFVDTDDLWVVYLLKLVLETCRAHQRPVRALNKP